MISNCSEISQENSSQTLFQYTLRAETNTEVILKGQIQYFIFSLEFRAFRPIPVICPALLRRAKPENYWKPQLIPDRTIPQ